MVESRNPSTSRLSFDCARCQLPITQLRRLCSRRAPMRTTNRIKTHIRVSCYFDARWVGFSQGREFFTGVVLFNKPVPGGFETRFRGQCSMWMDRPRLPRCFRSRRGNRIPPSISQGGDVPMTEHATSSTFRQDVHDWFELSLCPIPNGPALGAPVHARRRQERFVACLNEAGRRNRLASEVWALLGAQLKNADGHYARTDPFRDYNRGRRRIPLNEQVTP